MRYCENCSKKLRVGGEYCPYCGAKCGSIPSCNLRAWVTGVWHWVRIMLPIVAVVVLAITLLWVANKRQRPFDKSQKTTIVSPAEQAAHDEPGDAPAPDTIPVQNILMHVEENEYDTAFRSDIKRKDISTISFLNTLKNAPSNKWDVSELSNGTVWAWTKPVGDKFALYIAGEGGVSAPEDCTRLFTNFVNARAINFSNAFSTYDVTCMYGMFWGCKALEELDVSDFDTSSVTDMSCMFLECASLNTLDLSNFDTECVTNMGLMFEHCDGLKELNIKAFNTRNVESMAGMFKYCTSLKKLDISNFRTANVQYMSEMFYYCLALERLDLSSFYTSDVVNMADMFEACASLTTLDLSNFDTSNVESMFAMFADCTNLINLNVANFDTHHVKTMAYMFSHCSSLTKLDLSSFDTGRVSDMWFMFSGCSGLTELDLSGFDTRNVMDMTCMFQFVDSQAIDLGAWETDDIQQYSGFMDEGILYKGRPWEEIFEGPASDSTDTQQISPQLRNVLVNDSENGDKTSSTIFRSNIKRSDISTITFLNTLKNAPEDGKWDVSAQEDGSVWAWVAPDGEFFALYIAAEGEVIAPTDCSNLFSSYYYTKQIDLTYLDTSNVENMEFLFAYCTYLEKMDLRNFDTSKVQTMAGMFFSCETLSRLDLSSFDTSNVSDMAWMFLNCFKLSNIDVSKFDTSRVTDMNCMFLNCFCLRELNLSNFNTHNVTDMAAMFSDCHELTKLDVTSFDTSNVENMVGMFRGCADLKNLDLSNFDTSNVCNMGEMFLYCGELKALNLGAWDTENVTDFDDFMDAQVTYRNRPWEEIFVKPVHTEKEDTITVSLSYPISVEDCMIIFKNYYGYELEDEEISVEVSRGGSGDEEFLYFERKMEFIKGAEPIPFSAFTVYVNTGVCTGGAQGHEDQWPIFQAEDYYR